MKRDFWKQLLPYFCALCLCLSLYVLRLQNGVLRWYDGVRGVWNESDCCVDALSQQELFDLTNGLTFQTKAALTRALEDFGG